MGTVFLKLYLFCKMSIFHVDGFQFSLLDVFLAGIILSLIGFAIGKIFLFVLGRR